MERKMDRLKKLEGKIYGEYELLEQIGKGTYGIVYRARKNKAGSRSTGQEEEDVAIKIINFKDAKDRHRELVQREIDLLQQVEAKKHPNIISFHGSFIHDGDPCVVMEICKNGTLFQKIRDLKEQNKSLDEDEFVDILLQIVSGVEQLHDMNIIHRDLKTKNILQGQDGKWKICDFGVAKVIEIAGRMTSKIGTPYYMCPEVINKGNYDQKADIWSLGCSCFEMATGNYAFEGTTVQDIQTLVNSGKIPETTMIEYSDEIKSLIVEMLSYEGACRPTIKTVRTFLEEYKVRMTTKHRDKETQCRRETRDHGTETRGVIYVRASAENREFYENESAKLQQTLVTEINNHKAADIVSYIKKLQKGGIPERDFKAKVTKHIKEDLFDRLYPVMQAMKIFEDARRSIQRTCPSGEDTVDMTFSHMDQSS